MKKCNIHCISRYMASWSSAAISFMASCRINNYNMSKGCEHVGKWVWQGCVHAHVAMQPFLNSILLYVVWLTSELIAWLTLLSLCVSIFKLLVNEHFIFKTNPLLSFCVSFFKLVVNEHLIFKTNPVSCNVNSCPTQ